MLHCLVVEDDPILNEVICDMLREMGHNTTAAFTQEEALRLLRFLKFELVVLDYKYSDGTCEKLSDYIACFCPNSRSIMITGVNVFPNGEHKTMVPGIDWVMRKPVLIDDLEALVDYAAKDAATYPTHLPHS